MVVYRILKGHVEAILSNWFKLGVTSSGGILYSCTIQGVITFGLR